jgi:type IV pilus assembly protein PilB
VAKSIVDILVSKGILDLTEASQIKKSAKEKDLLPEDVLYSRGITETDVAEAKSILSGYPVKYLQGLEVPFEMLKDIPEESAKHYQIIPLGRREGYIEIGVLSPDDIDTQEAIKFISSRVNLPARIFIVTPSDFGKILTEYKSLSGEVTRALGEFEKEYEKLGAEIKLPKKGSARIVEDAPVTKMMGVILRHAVEGRASDVHIEPVKNNLRVRFRVDGVLHTSLTLPSDTHSAIVTRIKVMTDLKLDETRVPQDGRFSARILERDIDFRVSTLPTSFGEKVVMRILDPATGIKELADLGFEGRNLEMVHEFKSHSV